ncbi:K+/H+ antiporter subunit F [Luteimonas terricola]|uniref:K+/H+ antiporter subunit F n=2 Tax=Luteimonas terricola TaxID=645597 RepID=A0ABQ2E6T1_9GAMM|nr:K+/H+ antiporter subunit F [Luteimonas terricola]
MNAPELPGIQLFGHGLVELAIGTAMYVVGFAMLLALWRLLRGPTVPDRILALDTLNVTAIAELMLLGMHLRTAIYFEAALIIAMLGFVSTVVLSKYVIRRDIVE